MLLTVQSRRVGDIKVGHAQWHRTQVGKNFLRSVLRVLNGQKIVVATFGVYPITRRNHLVGNQRRNDVADDFFFIQTQFSTCAKSWKMFNCSEGIIHILRHQHIANTRQRPALSGNFGCDFSCALSMSLPVTWTSKGAGMPRLRIASTRPPVWRYAEISGNSFRNRARTLSMYSKLLKLWPALSPT